MEYRETPAPAHLTGIVKASWSLTSDGDPDEWIERKATPDGCIEIIWRQRGRSIWRREQPEFFVGGLIDRPALLKMSGDAVFRGVRLWPWAWGLIDQTPVRDFINDWREWDRGDPDRVLTDIAVPPALALMARAIQASGSVADLVSRTGRSHRWLQRWFARHVGIAPRGYLSLLRFNAALTALQGDGDTLAGHAAETGYADQAHMTRTFRTMADTSPRTARRKASGPFI